MTLRRQIQGSGIDIVLLHGWGMHGRIWGEFAQELARSFRVHAVDLPGYGRSRACEPYTLENIADNIAPLMPSTCTVLGWSQGGQVALDWALRYPSQIAQLVLMATTPRFVRGPGWECGMDVEMLEGFARGLKENRTATLQRFLALQAQGDAHAGAVLRRLRQCMRAGGDASAGVLDAGLRMLKATDLRQNLSRIAQPALILHGERDTIVPLAAAEYLASELPNAEFEIRAGAAHAPFVLHSKPIAQCIAEFCLD